MAYGQQPGQDPHKPAVYCPDCRGAVLPLDRTTTHTRCHHCGVEFCWRKCGCAYRVCDSLPDVDAPPAPPLYIE